MFDASGDNIKIVSLHPGVIRTELKQDILKNFCIKILFFAGCLLNFHEGVRTQATSWIPFAWDKHNLLI